MSEQRMITLHQVQERLKQVEQSNKDIRKILEIQEKILDKLIENNEKTNIGEPSSLIKKGKIIRITKIIAGIVWLAGSTSSAICFGMVSGLRGIGEGIQEYPYYWYAVVFSYILSSGILPAAYLMFGNRITKERCVNTDNSQVTDNTQPEYDIITGREN